MEQIDFARIPLYARRGAVSRHDADPHLLEILATDPDDSVRLAVAGHPATPLESLQRLANDAVSRGASRVVIRAAACRMAGEEALA